MEDAPFSPSPMQTKVGGLTHMTDKQLAEWLVDLCLLYGSTLATAYTVAGLFMKGLGR